MIARPSLRFALVLAAIFAASPAVGSAYAEDTDAFRKLGADEAQRLKAAGGYIIGDYGLSAPAISAIRESKILAKAVKRIETVDWKKKPFTKLNAELTIRQRMDHYLASSIAFYTGKAKKNKRQAKRSNLELGDEQLSNALQSVKLAAAWNVPLKPEQIRKLALAIRYRASLTKIAVGRERGPVLLGSLFRLDDNKQHPQQITQPACKQCEQSEEQCWSRFLKHEA